MKRSHSGTIIPAQPGWLARFCEDTVTNEVRLVVIGWRIDAKDETGQTYGVPIVCDPGEPTDQPVLDARDLADSLGWEFFGVMHRGQAEIEQELREDLAAQERALAAEREAAR